MGDRINLADPAFEPSDAQLTELSARAFAGVGAAHEHALALHRSAIAAARVQVLLAIERHMKMARERP